MHLEKADTPFVGRANTELTGELCSMPCAFITKNNGQSKTIGANVDEKWVFFMWKILMPIFTPFYKCY